LNIKNHSADENSIVDSAFEKKMEAARLGMEKYQNALVELADSPIEFPQAASYVIEKNAELYRRLS
jgi:hypothetical protein